jgi:general stress protein 26
MPANKKAASPRRNRSDASRSENSRRDRPGGSEKSDFSEIHIASRPHMPGYGILPASEGKGLLKWAWAEKRLAKSHSYWLVTVRPNGTPHAMPIWGIWVDSGFYFSTGRKSRKGQNLAANPRCVVCTEDPEEAVVVEGIAEEIVDAAEIRRLGVPYQKKYKWKLDPQLGPVFQVRPKVVFGLEEKNFVESATRWKVS